MSDEDRVREHVDGMLECQRLVIAKASLAGCRFVPHTQKKWAGDLMPRWRDVTYYEAFLPEGLCIGTTFRDQYEAACACVDFLDNTDPVVDKLVDMFTLEPENEQPKAVMARRWRPWDKITNGSD